MIQRLPEFSSLMNKMNWVDAIFDVGPRGERYVTLWALCQACWHPELESQPTLAAIAKAFDDGDLVGFQLYLFLSFWNKFPCFLYGIHLYELTVSSRGHLTGSQLHQNSDGLY